MPMDELDHPPRVRATTTTTTLPTPAADDASLIAPRPGRILVVEDRDDVRLGIEQVLELYGYQVADARDADTALRQLQHDPDSFALILLDLVLPGSLDGWALRDRQLSDPRMAAIPAVVMTATEPEPAARGRLRPDGWLDKPFRVATLLAEVRRFAIPDADGAHVPA
ncbi:MAG: response regulator [Vicinamibacterales bacterium]